MSSGDSSRVVREAEGCAPGVGTSESDAGGEGSWLTFPEFFSAGESAADLARKLGIGREEGAGEAWKVAPAKAAAIVDFGPADCGGVLLPGLAGAGEVLTFLGRDLLFRLADLVLWATDAGGAGLPESDFRGVAGESAG